MTLRYHHGKPVGLDWNVCYNPEVSAPKERAPRTDIKNPGSGRGQLQRLASDIEAQIIEMYQKGMTAYPIAKAFNITHKTVYRVLQRNDIPTRSMSQAMIMSHARRSQDLQRL